MTTIFSRSGSVLIALASRYFVSSDSKAEDRVLGLGVLEGVDQAELVALLAADAEQLVERHDVDERDLAEDLVQVVERDAHLGGDLGLGGRAVQLGLEAGVGLLDLARLVADRARDPVDRPQLVDDRAADAADRVGLELDRALEVELLDGVDQPEDAVRDEVGLLDVRRQADADPAGDVLHQRRVVQDQPLAQRRLAGLLEVLPELAQRRLGGALLGGGASSATSSACGRGAHSPGGRGGRAVTPGGALGHRSPSACRRTHGYRSASWRA